MGLTNRPRPSPHVTKATQQKASHRVSAPPPPADPSPPLIFTLELGGDLALLARPAKLLAPPAKPVPGAMNPYDIRFADPSSYHDRRRYANPDPSFSDPI